MAPGRPENKPTGLRAIVAAMPDVDQYEFFQIIERALLWRGWDDGGKHNSLVGCHACDAVAKIATLCHRNGVELPEYT